MATATKSIKPPRKAPAKTRDPLFSDESHTGREPVWDTERALKMPQDEFDHHLRKSFHYYNYYYSQKDVKKYVMEWMKQDYTKQQISKFSRASDKAIPMTACSLVMASRQGMPLREKELTYLKAQIDVALFGEDSDDSPVSDVPKSSAEPVKMTIQDRLNEKTSELIGELEGKYDDLEEFKAYDWFVTNNVVQSQLTKYTTVYTNRRVELELAQTKQDAQLVEGYKHYKAADFKKRFAWIDELLAAIDQYRGVKKATKKARVKRAPNKEKVVEKLKYLKEEKTLKLVSINPVDIVGAQELWCYNYKTRKLFRYVADSITGPLGVKGTSITGFDTAKSTGKTLRKPAEKLKEFAKASKVQLRKFMDDIKATETLANGRINAETVLLRIA